MICAPLMRVSMTKRPLLRGARRCAREPRRRWAAAARRGGRSDQGPDIGGMHDRVMIDAGTPDRDADLWLFRELGRSLAQGNEVHRALPSRRDRAEGGDPQHAIGLSRRDEPLGVEPPWIMDRDAGAESGSHREAGRPPAGREHARAIVRRGERQGRETRGVVQVAHKPVQHLDFKRAETLRGPNRNAEARALQGGRERVEDGQRQPGARASAFRGRAVFDTRTQRRKIGCERCATLRSPDLDIALEPTEFLRLWLAPAK